MYVFIFHVCFLTHLHDLPVLVPTRFDMAMTHLCHDTFVSFCQLTSRSRATMGVTTETRETIRASTTSACACVCMYVCMYVCA